VAISPETTGWLMLGVLLILLFLRVPVAYLFALTGLIGYMLISGLEPALNMAGMTMYSSIAIYSFSVVPMFILMGYFAFHAGITSQLYDTAKKWVGHIPGGLAQATILGGAGFGAVSGSGLASTATLARVTIPEMICSGVNPRLAYGVVASAGPLAQMIPPSIMMVMYAIIAEQPIGKLLIGGIMPGILTALIYMLLVYLLVKRKPELAPSIPKVPWKERFSALKQMSGFAILGFVIIVGIYTGFFTPNEAGAIGAFVSFLLLVFMRKFNMNVLKNSLLETVKTTSMVFLIVASSFIFGYFLGITHIPTNISQFLADLPVPPHAILIGIVVMYLILGIFVDMLAAMFLTLPIILPAVEALGFDLIWFGVLLVFLCEVALVTPPFGLSLFIIKGSVPESNLNDIIKGSIPFILADLVIIALLILFPEIVTFLPNLMKGNG
jgi:tripartite ATP-independent transporter DctM subunit